MQKLPIVSGEKLVKLLLNLGYEIVRQRGSHVRLRKQTEVGEHNITVPMHSEIAKGTLKTSYQRFLFGTIYLREN